MKMLESIFYKRQILLLFCSFLLVGFPNILVCSGLRHKVAPKIYPPQHIIPPQGMPKIPFSGDFPWCWESHFHISAKNTTAKSFTWISTESIPFELKLSVRILTILFIASQTWQSKISESAEKKFWSDFQSIFRPWLEAWKLPSRS